MDIKAIFFKIFDATPLQLLELQSVLPRDQVSYFYADVIKSYLSNHPQLQICAGRELTGESDWDTAILLARLRSAIRTNSQDPEAEQKLIANFNPDSFWVGEICFVLGMYFEITGNDEASKKYFGLAHEYFLRDGIFRKSIKSLQNTIAADSRLMPQRRFFYEYNQCFNLAMKHSEYGGAGMALVNLSREYQIAGAFQTSLQVVEKALEILGKHLFGVRDYYLALAQRCHVLIDLQKTDAAWKDLQELKCSDLSEIQHAAEVLQAILNPTTPVHIEPAVRNATWRERHAQVQSPMTRLSDSAHASKLSHQEQLILDLLAESPKTKVELIESLFGNWTNMESYENRLKQILHRLRRKRPNLIELTGSHYKVVDNRNNVWFCNV